MKVRVDEARSDQAMELMDTRTQGSSMAPAKTCNVPSRYE